MQFDRADLPQNTGILKACVGLLGAQLGRCCSYRENTGACSPTSSSRHARGRPGGVAEAYLGTLALKQDARLRLLLGCAHVLGQTGQSPVVCLGQVPVQDVSNLLCHSTTSFTRVSLGPGLILMQRSETGSKLLLAFCEKSDTISCILTLHKGIYALQSS